MGAINSFMDMWYAKINVNNWRFDAVRHPLAYGNHIHYDVTVHFVRGIHRWPVKTEQTSVYFMGNNS